MSSVNKVILLGNIGKDPEVRETKAGNIVNLVMATSEKYTDKSGQKQENTEWHNLVVFGKLADVVAKYVKKGDKLYVEGIWRFWPLYLMGMLLPPALFARTSPKDTREKFRLF